jgi:hypothetical protein
MAAKAQAAQTGRDVGSMAQARVLARRATAC